MKTLAGFEPAISDFYGDKLPAKVCALSIRPQDPMTTASDHCHVDDKWHCCSHVLTVTHRGGALSGRRESLRSWISSPMPGTGVYGTLVSHVNQQNTCDASYMICSAPCCVHDVGIWEPALRCAGRPGRIRLSYVIPPHHCGVSADMQSLYQGHVRVPCVHVEFTWI